MRQGTILRTVIRSPGWMAGIGTAALCGTLALGVLAMVRALGRLTGTPQWVLTRDPFHTQNFPFYYGILTDLSVMAWTATAAIALFAGWQLRARATTRESGACLIAWGALAAVLAGDDRFGLHEEIMENHLGGSELYVFVAYALALLWILWRFRATILAGPWLVLASALAAFAASLAMDVLHPAPSALIEDGFKFIGIVLLLGYVVHAAGRDLARLVARAPTESRLER